MAGETTRLDPHEIDRYLRDWGRDHRDLDPRAREHVARYIAAILAREPFRAAIDEEAVAVRASELWHAFRIGYDGLRGPFGKSDDEDVARAMSRM